MELIKQNFKMLTPDELLRLAWQAEETHDGRLQKKVQSEIRRRIKYDY